MTFVKVWYFSIYCIIILKWAQLYFTFQTIYVFYDQERGELCRRLGLVWCIVFNTTVNNISIISWRSFLLVEETGVPGENNRYVASHWQTLSHNITEKTETWTTRISLKTGSELGLYKVHACHIKLRMFMT